MEPVEVSKNFFRKITVEPTMFLYMFAFQLTSVVEQAFFVDKACRVDHNYSAGICDNLTQHADIKKEVQITVSNFHQWNNIAGHAVPIVIALFLGSWSDRRGRKLPLLLGLTGKCIYSLAVIVNAYNDTWPLEYIIYSATIPGALTGSDVAIFASAFAYIADVSSVDNRTLRITILDVCYMVTFPIGIALGSYLFSHVVNRSYVTMFIMNAALLFSALIYSLVNLEWLTTEKQRSIRELSCTSVIPDFFDRQHVRDSFRTLTRSRAAFRRVALWMLLVSMAFYTFQRDERPFTYLYTQLKFSWGTELFSNFKTFQSTIQNLVLLLAVPVMTRFLRFRDTSIAMIGAFAFASARAFFALAEVQWVFYIGGLLSGVGPVVAPMLRSMTSKTVRSSERGKVFALLAVCDQAVPFISGVLYTQVYNASIGRFPYFFALTAATQCVVFILMLCIHVLPNDESPGSSDESLQTS